MSTPALGSAANLPVRPNMLPLDSDPTQVARCIAAGRLLGALAFVVGLIVFLGWVLGLPALTDFQSGMVATPNMAIGLMAAAASGLALPPPAVGQLRFFGRRSELSAALAVSVLVIGVATLAELTFARGLDIDRFLVFAIPVRLVNRYPVRMSGTGALGLALLGAALLANVLDASWLAQALALGAAAIGLVVLAGHLYEAAALADSPLFAEAALPAGPGFLFAGLSIVAARPTVGLMWLFTSEGLGGMIVRRALLPIVLAPVLFNWLELSGERRGWYPPATGWTLDAMVTITALAAITWWGASVIQRRDNAQRRMAARLTESEERYRQLVETSPDAIIIKRGGRIEEVNRATLTLLGAADRQELIGRSPFALVEPSRRSAVESRFCAVLDEPGASVAVEDRVLRTDGTLVDVSVSASAVQVAGSRLIQVRMRDISERKRHEQVLRESEERFRLIAETITQVFWMADRQIETTLYVSPAYEQVWGRSRESLYSSPRSFLDPVHPDDRDRVLHDLEVQQAGESFDHDYRIICPDGQIRWIRDRGYPVRGEAGQVRLYVGVAEDITERTEHAEHLRESLERFELIARATHDAIWEVDVPTGATWWSDNYRQQFDLGPGMTPGMDAWAAGIHPEDRDRVLASFAAALDGTGEEWSDEYRYRRPDGSFADVHDRAFIVRDATTRAPLRVVGSVQDVSAQRSLEAQVRQAQKMEAVGQLAGGVAHDFNNTLTAISGFAELLLADEPADSARRPDLIEIKEAARRAAALTRQLLLFSRREVLEVSRFDVNEAIRNFTRMLRRTIGEDIHVELALDPEPLFVDGDAGMFDQIILNLAVNARDAMPKGGRLTIQTTSETAATIPAARRADAGPGPYVRVTVTDTGEGIPPEILPRIFEPFFTTKPAGKGTGLGLATVFGIAEQHRGWIDAESRLGEGTTMRLWLPASRSATAPRRAPRPAAAAGGGGETILVVEDDPAALALTQAVLSRAGYNVLVATDGLEALTVWEANAATIGLLLTDIVMPSGINGPELAARLQAAQPALKVLLTSGYSPDFAGMQIAADEYQGFLHKPFTPDQLLAAVRRALGRAATG